MQNDVKYCQKHSSATGGDIIVSVLKGLPIRSLGGTITNNNTVHILTSKKEIEAHTFDAPRHQRCGPFSLFTCEHINWLSENLHPGSSFPKCCFQWSKKLFTCLQKSYIFLCLSVARPTQTQTLIVFNASMSTSVSTGRNCYMPVKLLPIENKILV